MVGIVVVSGPLGKEEKRCSICGLVKSLNDFHRSKSSFLGVKSACKLCSYPKIEAYKLERRELLAEKQRAYYLSPAVKARTKLWRKARYAKNKEDERSYNTRYCRERKKIDNTFKLITSLRSRLYKVVRGQLKVGSFIRDLGCSAQHLKMHLELFWDDGMTWENYCNANGWVIDHILPLASFNLEDRTEFLVACNYRNLQPLWIVDNQAKVVDDLAYIRRVKDTVCQA